VNGSFGLVTAGIADYRRRDRVLVGQAAAILLMQLAAWLGSAFIVAGSSLFTLGFREPAGAPSLDQSFVT
jgi:hypothetical protein